MVKIAFFVMPLGAPICWILLSFEWTYFPSSCFSLLQYYWRFLWIAFKKQKSQFFNKSQFRSNYHVTGGWYQTSKENSVYQCDGFKVDLQLVWKLREELKILMGGRGLTILNCTSIIGSIAIPSESCRLHWILIMIMKNQERSVRRNWYHTVCENQHDMNSTTDIISYPNWCIISGCQFVSIHYVSLRFKKTFISTFVLLNFLLVLLRPVFIFC